MTWNMKTFLLISFIIIAYNSKLLAGGRTPSFIAVCEVRTIAGDTYQGFYTFIEGSDANALFKVYPKGVVLYSKERLIDVVFFNPFFHYISIVFGINESSSNPGIHLENKPKVRIEYYDYLTKENVKYDINLYEFYDVDYGEDIYFRFLEPLVSYEFLTKELEIHDKISVEEDSRIFKISPISMSYKLKDTLYLYQSLNNCLYTDSTCEKIKIPSNKVKSIRFLAKPSSLWTNKIEMLNESNREKFLVDEYDCYGKNFFFHEYFSSNKKKKEVIEYYQSTKYTAYDW